MGGILLRDIETGEQLKSYCNDTLKDDQVASEKCSTIISAMENHKHDIVGYRFLIVSSLYDNELQSNIMFWLNKPQRDPRARSVFTALNTKAMDKYFDELEQNPSCNTNTNQGCIIAGNNVPYKKRRNRSTKRKSLAKVSKKINKSRAKKRTYRKK